MSPLKCCFCQTSRWVTYHVIELRRFYLTCPRIYLCGHVCHNLATDRTRLLFTFEFNELPRHVIIRRTSVRVGFFPENSHPGGYRCWQSPSSLEPGQKKRSPSPPSPGPHPHPHWRTALATWAQFRSFPAISQPSTAIFTFSKWFPFSLLLRRNINNFSRRWKTFNSLRPYIFHTCFCLGCLHQHK